MDLRERREKCKAVMMHKILNHKAPSCFLGLFRPETGANFYDISVPILQEKFCLLRRKSVELSS
jgi:hypothetical protein